MVRNTPPHPFPSPTIIYVVHLSFDNTTSFTPPTVVNHMHTLLLMGCSVLFCRFVSGMTRTQVRAMAEGILDNGKKGEFLIRDKSGTCMRRCGTDVMSRCCTFCRSLRRQPPRRRRGCYTYTFTSMIFFFFHPYSATSFHAEHTNLFHFNRRAGLVCNVS